MLILSTNRLFIDYYVENKAIVVSRDTWNYEDKDITSGRPWKVDDFLREEGYHRTVIGATFGMGKTSLAKHIAIEYATKFLYTAPEDHNYIPVFVALKDKKRNVFFDKRLDYVLDKIVAPEDGRNRRILLVCDGLDEYGDSIEDLLKYLDEKQDVLPNMKVIITTRLKAGLLQSLNVKQYIRILPFEPEEVNKFFEKYGMQSINFETLLYRYGLNEKEIQKPFFCWIFAIVYNSGGALFEDIKNENMKRALIYQEFIHSIIRGKHRELAEREYDYTEYDIDKEKKTLRKIAPLKMIYEDNLTENIVRRDIAKFEDGLTYDDEATKNEDLSTILSPIISSYFYLQSSTSDPKIDFIHESFKEYLLAEYYIESLLINKLAPYRLSVGIPSFETIAFLNGLLELLTVDTTDGAIIPYRERFLTSLTFPNRKQQIDISEVKTILSKNVQICMEDEQIVFQKEREKKELWNTVSIPITKYGELLVHQWICIYILSTLNPNGNLDCKRVIPLLYQTTSSVPHYLMKLNAFNFSNAKLFYLDLSQSDLSNTNLSHTDLAYANLWHTNLSHADLSYADMFNARLRYADMSYANLSYAKLSNARISNARLSYAKLSYARLSNADLSYSWLQFANLSNADLSNAKLSNSKLFHSDLSNANLSNAKLPDANLSHTNLSHTNLSNAFLASSLLLGCKVYNSMTCKNANFDNALTDDKDLIIYLERHSALSIPVLLNSKSELRSKLKKRGLPNAVLEEMVRDSPLQ